MMPSTPTQHEGWYWHTRSQRPAYVFEGQRGWVARFVWRDPEDRGAFQHDGLLNSVNVEVTPQLRSELLPLAGYSPSGREATDARIAVEVGGSVGMRISAEESVGPWSVCTLEAVHEDANCVELVVVNPDNRESSIVLRFEKP